MTTKQEDLHSFLSRHVPSQISNTQKLCYRHRPDLVKNRGLDEFDILKIQSVNIVYTFFFSSSR